MVSYINPVAIELGPLSINGMGLLLLVAFCWAILSPKRV